MPVGVQLRPFAAWAQLLREPEWMSESCQPPDPSEEVHASRASRAGLYESDATIETVEGAHQSRHEPLRKTDPDVSEARCTVEIAESAFGFKTEKYFFLKALSASKAEYAVDESAFLLLRACGAQQFATRYSNRYVSSAGEVAEGARRPRWAACALTQPRGLLASRNRPCEAPES